MAQCKHPPRSTRYARWCTHRPRSSNVTPAREIVQAPTSIPAVCTSLAKRVQLVRWVGGLHSASTLSPRSNLRIRAAYPKGGHWPLGHNSSIMSHTQPECNAPTANATGDLGRTRRCKHQSIDLYIKPPFYITITATGGVAKPHGWFFDAPKQSVS